MHKLHDYHRIQNKNFNIINDAYKFPFGSISISDLNIQSYPLWEIYSPELSWRHISDLQSKQLGLKLKSLLKPIYYRARSYFFSIYEKRNNKIFENAVSHISRNSNFELICCFDFRMYREILESISSRMAVDQNVLLITNFELKNDIKSLNIVHVNIKKFVIDKNFSGEFKKAISQIRESTSSYNILPNLVGRLLALVLHGLLYKDLYYYYCASILFEHLKINSVTTADISDSKIRIFLAKANLQNIPRSVYQFGLIDEHSYEWRFHMGCDFRTWGAVSSEILYGHGIKTKNIITTGSPRFERYKNISRPESCRKVVFASTYSDRSHSEFYPAGLLETMIRDIYLLLSQINNSVIIKPHPADPANSLFKKFQNPCFIILKPGDDVVNFISPGDLFISFGSTLSFDAIAAGADVIFVAYEKWPFLSSLIRDEVFTVVNTNKKLFDAVINCLSGPPGKYAPSRACLKRYIENI